MLTSPSCKYIWEACLLVQLDALVFDHYFLPLAPLLVKNTTLQFMETAIFCPLLQISAKYTDLRGIRREFFGKFCLGGLGDVRIFDDALQNIETRDT